jgi:hypothetical protein
LNKAGEAGIERITEISMAYDEGLAERMRMVLESEQDIEEKHMFGGIGFLLHGNMACGVHKDWLIVRVGPTRYQELIGKDGIRDFDLTGRPMRGWIVVEPERYAEDSDLSDWIRDGIDFALTLPSK